MQQLHLFDPQRATVLIVAYRDGETMPPVTNGDALALFPDLQSARAAAGALGVAAPVTTARACELARRYGLALPEVLR
jgi:hypothetical protein